MKNDRATFPGAAFAGWRIMRSDEGRLWASRERPFPVTAEAAGACRTVDADDLRELGLAISAQESLAEQTTPEQENVTEQVSAADSAATA